MISPVSILPPMDFKDHLSLWYVSDKTWDTSCKINVKNNIHLLSPLSSLLFPSDCASIYTYVYIFFSFLLGLETSIKTISPVFSKLILDQGQIKIKTSSEEESLILTEQ